MTAMTKTMPAPSVNGLPVDDVRALIGSVQTDASKGMTHWKVASSWQGGARSRGQVESYVIGGRAITRRFALDIDEPVELGGGDSAANPQEYLLAALNACMTVGFTALCALNDVTIDKLEITTEGSIDLRGFFGLDASVPPGYGSLQTTFRVKGSATEEKFREIFATMLATSPNVHNITKPVALRPVLMVE
jgi:uncharacterized OsmC-like protein